MSLTTSHDTLMNIEHRLKFLTKSDVRINILKYLKQKPYSIKEIVNDSGMSYSSVSNNMHKLEEREYIYKDDGKYKISVLTEMYIDNVLDFNKSVRIINDYKEFWHKHNINDLDFGSIKNINDIYNSKLIKSTPSDIYKTYEAIKTQIRESKNINAIFPYLHPDFPKIIENAIVDDARIDLIVNTHIYKKLIFNIDPEIYKKGIKNQTIKITPVKKFLNIYLAICDDSMSLGLFKTDESFDQNRILISYNEKAINWSIKLFNVIKNRI